MAKNSHPLYGSDEPLDGDTLYLLEMFCQCGGVWRQLDPPSHLLPQIEDWKSKHGGKGHGPVSGADALEERESRREAGFRSAGRQDEYKPKKHAAAQGDGFDWTKE